MDWRKDVRRRLADDGRSPDEQVVEELAQHAESAYQAARASGSSATEARAEVDHMIEAWCAEPRVRRRRQTTTSPAPPPASTSGTAGLGLDVLYGLRLLRRQPGASLLAILTIALAVGTTTTLASVAYGVLGRPFPYPDADRLVRVIESRAGGSQGRRFLTNVGYHSWRDGATTIDALAGYSSPSVTIDDGAGPRRVSGAYVTAGLFDLLGTAPVRGRAFDVADEQAENTAIISFGLWQRAYGGRDDVVGRILTVEGERLTIVGVLPEDFMFPERGTEVWMPFQIDPLTLEDGRHMSLEMFSGIARLKAGVSADAATAEATAAIRNAAPTGMVGVAVFGSDGEPEITATPWVESMTAEVRPALLVLLAGVLLLFATAVGGIATMQVARALSRRREVAIRAAIGAGGSRIARQLWLEHLSLGLIGGAVGLVLAWGLHATLPGLLPADFPRVDDIVLDWRIALLAGGLAVATSVLTSVFPMLQALRVDLAGALTADGRAPSGTRLRTPASRLRGMVMTVQVALTVVLLVGAMLLGRSFLSLQAVDRGYEPSNLLTAQLPVPGDTLTPAARAELFENVTTRLAALPDVLHAGYGAAAPFMPGGPMLGLTLSPDSTGQSEPRSAKAELLMVSADYLAALDARVLEGRGFQPTDIGSAEAVLMVNRSFAREYLPNGAVDVQLPLAFLGERDSWRVIGVVDDIAPAGPGVPAAPVILALAPQFQSPMGISTARLVIRTVGNPVDVVPALRTIAAELAPQLPLDGIMTMRDRLSASLSRPRLYALLLAGFSACALLIAGVGLFAVLSHGVASRRRELGVRLALGATPGGLLARVLLDGLRLATIGAVVGLGLAWALARSVDTLLFGVTPSDPASYVMGVAFVLAAAVLACSAPALRAGRVDPIAALRD